MLHFNPEVAKETVPSTWDESGELIRVGYEYFFATASDDSYEYAFSSMNRAVVAKELKAAKADPSRLDMWERRAYYGGNAYDGHAEYLREKLDAGCY